MAGYYVNVQVGEDLVTNPQAFSIPDEFLVADWLAWNVTKSSTSATPISSPPARHPDERRSSSWPTYGPDPDALPASLPHPLTDRDFAMDIEFKITADGRLNIKQARPWVE